MATSFGARIFDFSTLFSTGYWLLLVAPFVVVPPIVWWVRRKMIFRVQLIANFFPDFTGYSYLALLIACYLFVFYSFARADAFNLFSSGADFTSSVEARFAIRDSVGFVAMAVLMSNLHYLSIYGCVKWVRGGGWLWGGVTIINALLVSVLLIALNMKWPILIYYAGIVMAIFVYTHDRPYVKTVAGVILLLVMYVLISAFVYRLAPSLAVTDPAGSQLELAPELHLPATPPAQTSVHRISSAGAALSERLPMMMFHAVNRMAISYPYYYEIFTTQGQVCGGLLAQARIANKCRPSYLVYSEMFDDRFKGRGTAPAAVHLTSYALGGWPLAGVGLICASILLGLFASLPLGASDIMGAMAITGGVMGYHLSQLPGEGPIIYDHGILWVIVMLCGYALIVKFFQILSS